MGAWVASLYAAEHPERVARLVLVNGGPLRHVPEGLTLLPADRQAARALMAALRDPKSPPILDFVLDDVVEQAAAGPIGRLFQDSDSLEARVLSEEQVKRIAVPTEIVWGASDRYMGRDYAERLDALLPRSRITWLDACGHVPASECPERLTTVLTKLLAEEAP
jgi:pimeloyl-ACP methyl ester carboxylesterase